MKLREIRLLDVEIYRNDEKIFEGKVEEAYKEYGEMETKEIYFEDGKMQIKI